MVSGAWTRRFDRALGSRQDHRAKLIALSDDEALQAAIVEALRALPMRFAISRPLVPPVRSTAFLPTSPMFVIASFTVAPDFEVG